MESGRACLQSVKYNNMKTIVSVLICLLSISMSSQKGEFSWTTETCEFKGTFDPKKLNHKQFDDTYKLWFSNYGNFNTETTAEKPADISKLSINSLDSEYLSKKHELEGFQLLPHPYWDSLRSEYLKEIKEVYELKSLTMKSYASPAILLKYRTTDSLTLFYAKTLNSKPEEILRGWEFLLERQCLKNGYPEKLREKYIIMRNSPDSLSYAITELTRYGWWNSPNHTIKYVMQNWTRSEIIFNSYFKSVKTIYCDEP